MYAEDLIVGNDEIRNRKATGRFSIPFRVRRKDGSDIWVRLDACRAEERWNGHEVLYCFYTCLLYTSSHRENPVFRGDIRTLALALNMDLDVYKRQALGPA